ncbi:pyridoxamine 5'-phosphate oxidase-domain-containing protein [Obelidium mucronatum]|nr:pyridoxamine 5'-phosphate oxidase-domain-containing protein [Obelidium mucronatum]
MKGGAWPSWLPTLNHHSHHQPEASEDDKLDQTTDHFPPWRISLETALKENERSDQAHLYASLATIKAFGRPSNRSVFFRGFLSDGIVTDDTTADAKQSHSNHHVTFPHHKHQPNKQNALSHGCLERLSNVLIFAVDVRSGSVEDLIHGSKFGEVCWIFPDTREQIRLSGQLHLVVAPTHPLSISHQVPQPFGHSFHFPQLDWEQTRKDVWRKISAVRRASFTWPTTHHDVGRSGGAGFHRIHHHEDRKPSVVGGAIATVIPSPQALQPAPLVTSLEATLSSVEMSSPEALRADGKLTAEPETSESNETEKKEETHHSRKSNAGHHHHHHQNKLVHAESMDSGIDHHSIAFSNFALLLLDVDGADHVQMQQAPHARTKYRRTIDPLSDRDHGAVTPGKVVRVSGEETVFSVDTLIDGGVTGPRDSVDGLVKKVAHWSVRDVLQESHH